MIKLFSGRQVRRFQRYIQGLKDVDALNRTAHVTSRLQGYVGNVEVIRSHVGEYVTSVCLVALAALAEVCIVGERSSFIGFHPGGSRGGRGLD